MDSLVTPPEPDIQGLHKKNKNIIGWVCIPDTDVNYPLLYSPDDHYLRYTPEEKRQVHGSIYTRQKLTDIPVYIFGHNMWDGSMFAVLHKYRDRDFAGAHDSLYLYTDKWHRYSFGGYVITDERHTDTDDSGDLCTVTCSGRKKRLIVRWNKDN